MLPELAIAIQDRLSVLVDQPSGGRVTQERRDGWLAFQKNSASWVQGTTSAWSKARSSSPTTSSSRYMTSGTLELMGNEVMEDKIIASRLALRLLDFAGWELSDLRLRIQHLDATTELDKEDIFRPEVLARHFVDQWHHALLTRESWLAVQDLIQKKMAEQMLEIYHATNEFLVRQGVMPEIDLRPMMRRTPSTSRADSGGDKGGASGMNPSGFGTTQRKSQTDSGGKFDGGSSNFGAAGNGASPYSPESGGSGGASGYRSPGGGTGRGSVDGAEVRRLGVGGVGSSGGTGDTGSGGQGNPATGGRAQSTGSGNPVNDETRMQTGTTPLARARMRALGVMGHLKRLLTDHVVGFDDTRRSPASPQLAQAITSAQRAEESRVDRAMLAGASGEVYGQAQVDEAMGALRARTSTLKKAATSSSEKATIEVVALMFQSILAEERIPAVIRVWFARLQIPVLRVALAEPEFFGSLQHPARRLIDRMGSCVLGFNVTVSGGAMESEVRRVVQVIEQYPETGRRVFQIVYDEFEKFLSKFLSAQGSTARVVTLAQQVEQKETMAIQYTIEMRSMLNDMPVRDGIREFLFKIWAEVLAIAAMKNGPQHQETIKLKRAAADLVWAASAKPSREDRSRVIANLPALLQLLRTGMSMLGLTLAEQDGHLKVISDTLADAFMSKTEGISLVRIEAMAKRLANLEDYLSEEDVGDLSLDTESLMTMIGLDAADVQIITDGGSDPTEAMRSWARELQLGAWFSLDHNGKITHVQFAWCSERKQLHLFASSDGRNFLIQAKRLAAYLQAGLLIPTEEEALTVRATRDALAKLNANPERLLG